MHDVLHVLAIGGVLFLFIWWLFHLRSGLIGLGCTVISSAVLLTAAFDWPIATLLADKLRWPVISVAFAGLLLVLLALLLIAVTASRRRASVAQVPTIPPLPQEMKCPHCRRRGLLYDYWVPSWRGQKIELMCQSCGERRGATMVDY